MLLTLAIIALFVGGVFEGVTVVRVRRLVPRRQGHAAPILGLGYTPSGDEILTLERDIESLSARGGVVRAWPIIGDGTSVVLDDVGSASDIAVAPRGDVLAVADDVGTIALYQYPKIQRLGSPIESGGWMEGSNFGGPRWVVFSRSGQRLAWTGMHAALDAADRSGRKLIERKKEPSERSPILEDWPVRGCWRVLGFTSEDTIAYASDASLRIWSIEKRAVVTELPTAGSEWDGHALSPRGTLWVHFVFKRERSTGATVDAPIVRVPSGERVGHAVIDDHAVVAFSHDDELIAIVGPKDVRVEEVKTGRSVARFEIPPVDRHLYSSPHTVEFSPTRDEVAVACDRTVWVFPFRR